MTASSTEDRQVRPRVVIMVTSPVALRAFFLNQIRFLELNGFEVHTLSSSGPELDQCRRRTRVPMHELPMNRHISPLADLRSLWQLFWLLRRLRPSILHTHTPKAGLLGMLAARAVRAPVRLYTINGLVLLSRTGWQRWLLICCERLACALATEVLCVSHSVRQVVIDEGICAPGKVRTLGDGGSHGVDLRRFSISSPSVRERFRAACGIPNDAPVLAYVGRIVRDKGVVELACAWRQLRQEFASLWLLLCGPREVHDPVPAHVLDELANDSRVCFIDVTPENMPEVYSGVDVVVLPTYREGLPNVALECGAIRIPIVGTRVPGCIDAIQDGVTGLLVEPRNPEQLTAALRRLLKDPSLRQSLGDAAAKFVEAHFDEKHVSKLLLEEYRRLLTARMGCVANRRTGIGLA